MTTKEELTITIDGDGYEYNRTKEETPIRHQVYGELVRLSPREFYAGERAGFSVGITAGFMFGFLAAIIFMCLVK